VESRTRAVSALALLAPFVPSLAWGQDPATVPSITHMAMRAGGALALVLALIGALVLLLQRLRAVGRPAANSQRMSVLERLDLGSKREIVLVRVDDRTLVVGTAGDRIELLSESDTPFASLPATVGRPASPMLRIPLLRKLASLT